jgi:WD40 repeat protein/serine/threonine protein kinase
MSSSSSDRDPLDKLAEEFAMRLRRGERPSLSEYTNKYPDLAEEMRQLLPTLALLEEFGSKVEQPTKAEFPVPGDAGPCLERIGEFRVLRKVGQGGMGVVYEAVQESLGRHVALKVLPFHALLNPTQVERFRRESRAAARLYHTNIVPVFAVGEANGIHYYAMQFIQGRGLDVVLQELEKLRGAQTATHPAPSPLSEQTRADLSPSGASECVLPESLSSLARQFEAGFFRIVARVGIQVAEALAYSHQQGVVHRDVKPSNLLLDRNGTVWITDFGLAKTAGTDALTSPGDIVGTIRYMAPESLRGEAEPRSDVYGLGATLYELLTLCPLFEETSRARLIESVAREEPTRPRKRNPRIPADLETIVLKAIAKEPAQRYAGAAILAEDLRCFLADQPIQARRSSTLEQARRWCRRNPTVARLTGAVVASLLLGVIVALLFALSAREQAADAERSRQEAITSLYHSLVSEARALRLAGETSFRTLAWERLQVARWLQTPERDLEQLRAEAVACLGDFVGLEPQVWNGINFGRAGGQRLALHPDGVQMALGLEDGRVQIRNLITQAEVLLHKHDADVSAVAFTPDGTKLVSGDVHGIIHSWQLDRARQWTWSRELRANPPLERPFFGTELALAISPDGRQVAACPGRVAAAALWDLAGGRHVRIQARPGELLRSIAWSPDSRILVLGANLATAGHRAILRWNVAGGRWMDAPWPINLGHILTVAFSPDGQSIAAGCFEGFAVFDTSDFRPLLQVRGDQARSLAFSRDNHTLYVASEALGSVQIWNVIANRQVAALQLPPGPTTVVLGSDGNTLFAASRKAIRAWNLRDTDEKRVLVGHTGAVPGLAFSPNGRLLASASKDHHVLIWDAASGKLLRDLGVFEGEIQAVAFSPDSRTLAAADWTGQVRLLDTQTWQDRLSIPRNAHGLGQLIWGVAFSPDGAWFAAGSYSNGVQVWRVRGRQGGTDFGLDSPPKTVVASGSVTGLCFSPDSRQLAWTTRGDADSGYRISYCDLEHFTPRSLPVHPFGFVKATPAFTPDSRHLLFVSEQERLEVWQVSNPPHRVASYGTEDLVTGNGAIALTPDGAWLASAGNRSVMIWDAAGQKLLLTLPEEHSSVSAVAWNPDGTRLAIGLNSGGLVIWDIPQIRAQLRMLDLDWPNHLRGSVF